MIYPARAEYVLTQWNQLDVDTPELAPEVLGNITRVMLYLTL